MSHAAVREPDAPRAWRDSARDASRDLTYDVTRAITRDVCRARAGDQTAFVRLVDAARPSVRAIVMRVLRDPELGRDVEQDVYATAWLNLSQLCVAERFFHWIRRIARNLAVRSLRVRVRERAQVELDVALATHADASPFPLDRLIDSETRAALYAAVASLPPTSREVILMHYRDGRPVDQVAEQLGVRADAVRQRLSRARAALRRALSARP